MRGLTIPDRPVPVGVGAAQIMNTTIAPTRAGRGTVGVQGVQKPGGGLAILQQPRSCPAFWFQNHWRRGVRAIAPLRDRRGD